MGDDKAHWGSRDGLEKRDIREALGMGVCVSQLFEVLAQFWAAFKRQVRSLQDLLLLLWRGHIWRTVPDTWDLHFQREVERC